MGRFIRMLGTDLTATRQRNGNASDAREIKHSDDLHGFSVVGVTGFADLTYPVAEPDSEALSPGKKKHGAAGAPTMAFACGKHWRNMTPHAHPCSLPPEGALASLDSTRQEAT